MSVSLNWDRLCIVCEKEGEELSREEATGKKTKKKKTEMKWHGASMLYAWTGKLQFYLQHRTDERPFMTVLSIRNSKQWWAVLYFK